MAVQLTPPPVGVRGSRVDLDKLRRRTLEALRFLGHSRSELSVALVSDEQMKSLNREWRGSNRPTDVLSFSLIEGEDASHRGRLLGDVVVGIETAAKQARARHRSLDEEVARLVIHGLLHIIGHDHEDGQDARVMAAEQRRLWQAVRSADLL